MAPSIHETSTMYVHMYLCVMKNSIFSLLDSPAVPESMRSVAVHAAVQVKLAVHISSEVWIIQVWH